MHQNLLLPSFARIFAFYEVIEACSIQMSSGKMAIEAFWVIGTIITSIRDSVETIPIFMAILMTAMMNQSFESKW